MRLQQAAAASLRPEDFGLDGLDDDEQASSSGDDEEMDAGTLGAAAAQVHICQNFRLFRLPPLLPPAVPLHTCGLMIMPGYHAGMLLKRDVLVMDLG